jgi:hypothetical protein
VTTARLYTIHFTARRFRWLPWPVKQLTYRKVTTWQDAERVASWFVEAGARDVHVHAGECDPSDGAEL